MYHSKRPEVILLSYGDNQKGQSPLLSTIKQAVEFTSIEDDPQIAWLRTRLDEKSKHRLATAILKQESGNVKELQLFVRRAIHMHENLGAWAADSYTGFCLRRLLQGTEITNQGFLGIKKIGPETEENRFFKRVLEPAFSLPETPFVADDVTEKVKLLVSLLQEQYEPGFRGIIFVEQKTTVRLLANLLELHPKTKSFIKPMGVVGDAGHAKKRATFDAHDLRDQKDAVERFREGDLNLLIGTPVLEEGIDVSSCHLVVCFDPVPHLRSFIQRRGRARRDHSKIAVFLNYRNKGKIELWGSLEKVMMDEYTKEIRELQAIWENEAVYEIPYEAYTVEATGYHHHKTMFDVLTDLFKCQINYGQRPAPSRAFLCNA